ncbi:MAG: hypothetical protein VX153_07910 [Verrucomicrobiota bacterium]|nr:hypothetical protein [Verrucomicrobiota bacterium]
MFNQKLVFINAFFWIMSLLICQIFEDILLWIQMVSVSALIANIVYLLIDKFNKDKSLPKEESDCAEKNAVMTDLDNELKRRKKEDVFLRN